HMGGRRNQLATQLTAKSHPPRHPVRPPQQVRHPAEIISRKFGTHAGTADPLTVELQRGRILHLKTMLLSGGRQRPVITTAVTAKAEIITDNQVLNP